MVVHLRYLLDTNICIYIAKQRPANVLQRFQSLQPGEVAMSVITYGELRYGASKSQRRADALKTLDELVTLIPALPLDGTAADYYGDLRSLLERSGTSIGNNDLWISAHALSLGITLVTNNEREFNRVAGLALENWAS
jgi:tRNA(fMet)-specific endonuclease VapC